MKSQFRPYRSFLWLIISYLSTLRPHTSLLSPLLNPPHVTSVSPSGPTTKEELRLFRLIDTQTYYLKETWPYVCSRLLGISPKDWTPQRPKVYGKRNDGTYLSPTKTKNFLSCLTRKKWWEKKRTWKFSFFYGFSVVYRIFKIPF